MPTRAQLRQRLSALLALLVFLSMFYGLDAPPASAQGTTPPNNSTGTSSSSSTLPATITTSLSSDLDPTTNPPITQTSSSVLSSSSTTTPPTHPGDSTTSTPEQLGTSTTITSQSSESTIVETTVTTVESFLFNKSYDILKDEFISVEKPVGDTKTAVTLPVIDGGVAPISYRLIPAGVTDSEFDGSSHLLKVGASSNLFENDDYKLVFLIATDSSPIPRVAGILIPIRGHNKATFTGIAEDIIISSRRSFDPISLPTATINPPNIGEPNSQSNTNSSTTITVSSDTTVSSSTVTTTIVSTSTTRLDTTTSSTSISQSPTFVERRCPLTEYSIDPPLPSSMKLNTHTNILSGHSNTVGSIQYTITAVMSLFTETDCTARRNDPTYHVHPSRITTSEATLNFTLITERNSTPRVSPRYQIAYNISSSLNSITLVEGAVYDIQFGLLRDGNRNINYSINPALPNGLMMNMYQDIGPNYYRLKLQGSPTVIMQPQTYIFQFTDRDGETAIHELFLAVEADILTSFANTSLSNNLMTGISYSFPIEIPKGNFPIFYSASRLPRGLVMNQRTGEIYGTPQLAIDTSSTIYARDANNDIASIEVMFSITENAFSVGNFGTFSGSHIRDISIDVPELTREVVGASYSISPPLPRNLILNSLTGRISGRASEIVPSTKFTVSVSENNQIVGLSDFSLLIERDLIPSFPYDNFEVSPKWRVGVPVALRLPAASGGDKFIGGDGDSYLRYSSTNLPTGFSIDQQNAEIRGTPTITGTHRFTLTVTDSDFDLDSMEITVVVLPAYIDLFHESVTDKVITFFRDIDFEYRLPLAALSLGYDPFSYSFNPSLPPGLSFDSTTNIISGRIRTTIAGSYENIVTDALGRQDSINVSFSVQDSIFNSPYSALHTEADHPVVFELDSLLKDGVEANFTHIGFLPRGLIYDATTRTISGTPVRTPNNLWNNTSYSLTRLDVVVLLNSTRIIHRLSIHVHQPYQPHIHCFNYNNRHTSRFYSVWYNEQFTLDNLNCLINIRRGNSYTLSLKQITDHQNLSTVETSFVITSSLPTPIRYLDYPMAAELSNIMISGLVDFVGNRLYLIEISTSNGGYDKFEIGLSSVRRKPKFNAADNHGYYFWASGINILTELPKVNNPENPVEYHISPALPTGLSMNSQTAVISGQSDNIETSTQYTLTATDLDEDTNSIQFSAGSTPDLQPGFSGTALRTTFVFPVNVPINHVSLPNATGGNGPLSYSLVKSNSTDNNIDIRQFHDSTRNTMNGTPKFVMGLTDFTLTATDYNGDKATITIRIEIEPDYPLTFRPYSNPVLRVHVGSRIEEEIYLTGGNGVPDTTISPLLPTGLNFRLRQNYSGRFDYTVVIYGYVEIAQPRILYTVTISDADGDSSEFSIDLEVRDPPDDS